MVQSPSWAANWFAASQEIPRISRNPKVHYRTQKRPPPVSILGPPNYLLLAIKFSLSGSSSYTSELREFLININYRKSAIKSGVVLQR